MKRRVIITGYAILDEETLEPVPGAISVAPGDVLVIHDREDIPDSVPCKDLHLVAAAGGLTGRTVHSKSPEPEKDEKDLVLEKLREAGIDSYDRRYGLETLKEALDEVRSDE